MNEYVKIERLKDEKPWIKKSFNEETKEIEYVVFIKAKYIYMPYGNTETGNWIPSYIDEEGQKKPAIFNTRKLAQAFIDGKFGDLDKL